MIRILLAEDEGPKRAKLTAALLETEGVTLDSITHVSDVRRAKQLLRSEGYDVLVVDIALPMRADETPTPDGGSNLVEEVLSRELYEVPQHIIGITAYEDAYERAVHIFSDHSLTLLRYDSNSNGWVAPLQARIRHTIAATQSSGARDEFRSDLVVFCALEDLELAAVRRLPWQWTQVTLPGDDGIYYEGVVRGRRVVATAAYRMGPSQAAGLAAKLTYVFRPRYLATVGIAAGIRGRVGIGDVLVADPTWDWGSGKWEAQEDGGDPQFLAAPYQHTLDPAVRQQMGLVRTDARALAEIGSNWPGTPPPKSTRVSLGPVASGASVIADKTLLSGLVQQHRKLVGIDMEIYSVYTGAECTSEPRPKVVAIKGVSDYADATKDDLHQPYAAYAAAEVTRLWAEKAFPDS